MIYRRCTPDLLRISRFQLQHAPSDIMAPSHARRAGKNAQHSAAARSVCVNGPQGLVADALLETVFIARRHASAVSAAEMELGRIL